jgi:transposase
MLHLEACSLREVRYMQKRHRVHLSEEEFEKLSLLVRTGIEKAQVITRARVLLLANSGKIDREIAGIFSLSTKTPYEIRKRYHTGGLTYALYDRPRPGQPRRYNGAQEAEIIAIACTKAPIGYTRWTLDLLTEKVREAGIAIGRTAVWKILLRSNVKPWRKKMWCIGKLTPEFKKRMLDVLEVYERPYDSKQPVVCIDEKSKQLLKEIREPIAVKRGKGAKADYEYERNGTCNLFVAVESKGAKRTVRVTRKRTGKDWALFIRYLVRRVYKRAKKLILVEDNLNIHNRKTLVKELGEEGRKIAQIIEWHYTPKHGSWLNQAEIEIHALETQCLILQRHLYEMTH